MSSCRCPEKADFETAEAAAADGADRMDERLNVRKGLEVVLNCIVKLLLDRDLSFGSPAMKLKPFHCDAESS